MRNKGYLLINGLIGFILISALFSQQITLKLLYLKLISEKEYLNERYVLEKSIIKDVCDKLYNFEEEDIVYEKNESTISITYDDLQANILVEGKFNFKSVLIYDDIDDYIVEYYYE